jgi:hypothetical protein
MTRLLKLVVVLTGVLLLALLATWLLPPWWGKPAWMLHLYTRVPYAFGWPPGNFSGVWLEYRTNGHEELSYLNGQRHGVQRYFDLSGKVERTYEFRNGLPWSGLCDFWDDKPWLMWYRDGKVWTGATSELDATRREWVRKYYFEGVSCDEAEYRELTGFGDGGSLIGSMKVGTK